MTFEMLKGKIHRATVVQAELDYVGSITVDEDLLDSAGILEYEKVSIVDINNGNRFETYTIAGERGSGMICLNGAAARCVQTGDKIIIMCYAQMTPEEVKKNPPKVVFVDVGSVIKLTIGDQEIPVTVSGLFINDGLKNGHGPLALDSTCMVATEELFQEAMPMIDCFDYSWSIVSDPQKAEQIENSLSAIISSNPDLDLDTIGIHKDYEEMENRVVFGGFQALSWLVFLFGVVNLINTTLSNQMSRKRENSVFRAIGLTRKQLCQMTIYEGICYAFSAALATLAVGLPIAVIFARKFSEMTFHVAMPYSFPFLQMGLFVLVLFGLEVILSFWTMRRQKNQSLVEEMRAME